MNLQKSIIELMKHFYNNTVKAVVACPCLLIFETKALKLQNETENNFHSVAILFAHNIFTTHNVRK